MNKLKKTLIIITSLISCQFILGQDKYEANWESLSQYECPEWFRDAKFGIYTHWGVYSVPKDESDWYGTYMYKEGHPNNKTHKENYGDPKEFGYKDLVPLFKAPKFDADEWADLFVEAGARFAGPAGEHADGFSMWDSKVNEWNSVDKGPKRDIVAEMEKAIRKRGLKYVVSLHHSWLWGWFPTWDESTDCADPNNASLYGEKVPETAWQVGEGQNYYQVNPMPSAAFEKVWLEKVKEVVDGYSPDLLWFDNRVQILSEKVRKEMMAYAYNAADKKEQEFVLTFKRPDFPLGTGTVDLERNRMPKIYPEPWLTDNSISKQKWIWHKDLKCYPTNNLVDDLVDIVSKNGNLLLNVAPHPNGTIPDDQKQRLREMGKWLKLNGEAIYESRPWLIYGEGPTEIKTGHLADMKFDGFGDEDIRFTTRNGQLYAIALGWPESGILSIKSLSSTSYNDKIEKIELIGSESKITFKQTVAALEIQLPKNKPCKHAFVFRIN
ncbi:alpha-L-fucosidase [Polaribacter sp. SA4-12]|uniref:alpha-L-fucosidase n=1 Tax=Polaribacter sp. SA4-12 TaxID=1312072 RepID=UPI000B3CF334|nr:alpha-L-fucosidase [Polaribacter sp. SA4-12]ARV16556.1 alpha-L-fucosidase [Polaribacter sp. SA4-12]